MASPKKAVEELQAKLTTASTLVASVQQAAKEFDWLRVNQRLAELAALVADDA